MLGVNFHWRLAIGEAENVEKLVPNRWWNWGGTSSRSVLAYRFRMFSERQRQSLVSRGRRGPVVVTSSVDDRRLTVHIFIFHLRRHREGIEDCERLLNYSRYNCVIRYTVEFID